MGALVAVSAAIAAGCGDGEEPAVGGDDLAGVGEGGALVWAVAQPPAELDPLLATGRTDLLATRQVHEPLVEAVSAPFDDPRQLAGLAASVGSARGDTVWRLRLREGIRFQDGSPFNAAAVLDNAERWRASPRAGALLGDFLVDAPRPDLVRFILPQPNRRFGTLLAAPRLGIVSPEALRSGRVRAGASGTGTGPFELRERSRGRILLARNTDWWGSDRGLGPAIDQLELVVIDDPEERLALLRDGRVQVTSLPPALDAMARADPLLATVVLRDTSGLTIERSVRGLLPSDPFPPMLNDVWRTEVRAG